MGCEQRSAHVAQQAQGLVPREKNAASSTLCMGCELAGVSRSGLRVVVCLCRAMIVGVCTGGGESGGVFGVAVSLSLG